MDYQRNGADLMGAVSHMALVMVRRPLLIVNPNAFAKIGDMTANGGLAALFDGVTVRVHTTAAEKASNTGYGGLNLGALFAISKAVLYASSDVAFNGTTGSAAPTLTLYAKTTAPATATDGTSLATVTSSGAAADIQTLISSDQSTLYQYVWATISGGVSGAVDCAQMQFTIMS